MERGGNWELGIGNWGGAAGGSGAREQTAVWKAGVWGVGCGEWVSEMRGWGKGDGEFAGKAERESLDDTGGAAEVEVGDEEEDLGGPGAWGEYKGKGREGVKMGGMGRMLCFILFICLYVH